MNQIKKGRLITEKQSMILNSEAKMINYFINVKPKQATYN